MWFFTSWRLNDQYQYILGLGDQTQRSKLSNKYTFKGTFQLNRNNQVIGFINKREKLQDKRGINLTTPLSAAYYQSSRNYPWKFEWTSVLGSRAFLDVLAGDWYNFFPLRPVRDYGLYDGPWSPGRQDLATCSSTMAARTMATRTRSGSSPSSTPRCRTSRTAGRAATT